MCRRRGNVVMGSLGRRMGTGLPWRLVATRDARTSICGCRRFELSSSMAESRCASFQDWINGRMPWQTESIPNSPAPSWSPPLVGSASRLTKLGFLRAPGASRSVRARLGAVVDVSPGPGSAMRVCCAQVCVPCDLRGRQQRRMEGLLLLLLLLLSRVSERGRRH